MIQKTHLIKISFQTIRNGFFVTLMKHLSNVSFETQDKYFKKCFLLDTE